MRLYASDAASRTASARAASSLSLTVSEYTLSIPTSSSARLADSAAKLTPPRPMPSQPTAWVHHGPWIGNDSVDGSIQIIAVGLSGFASSWDAPDALFAGAAFVLTPPAGAVKRCSCRCSAWIL